MGNVTLAQLVYSVAAMLAALAISAVVIVEAVCYYEAGECPQTAQWDCAE